MRKYLVIVIALILSMVDYIKARCGHHHHHHHHHHGHHHHHRHYKKKYWYKRRKYCGHYRHYGHHRYYGHHSHYSGSSKRSKCYKAYKKYRKYCGHHHHYDHNKVDVHHTHDVFVHHIKHKTRPCYSQPDIDTNYLDTPKLYDSPCRHRALSVADDTTDKYDI